MLFDKISQSNDYIKIKVNSEINPHSQLHQNVKTCIRTLLLLHIIKPCRTTQTLQKIRVRKLRLDGGRCTFYFVKMIGEYKNVLRVFDWVWEIFDIAVMLASSAEKWISETGALIERAAVWEPENNRYVLYGSFPGNFKETRWPNYPCFLYRLS
jgi:hypothetical protein